MWVSDMVATLDYQAARWRKLMQLSPNLGHYRSHFGWRFKPWNKPKKKSQPSLAYIANYPCGYSLGHWWGIYPVQNQMKVPCKLICCWTVCMIYIVMAALFESTMLAHLRWLPLCCFPWQVCFWALFIPGLPMLYLWSMIGMLILMGYSG